jgi:hypothetical protein
MHFLSPKYTASSLSYNSSKLDQFLVIWCIQEYHSDPNKWDQCETTAIQGIQITPLQLYIYKENIITCIQRRNLYLRLLECSKYKDTINTGNTTHVEAIWRKLTLRQTISAVLNGG